MRVRSYTDSLQSHHIYEEDKSAAMAQTKAAYGKNCILPYGDITTLDADRVPDHDILFAGFPTRLSASVGICVGSRIREVRFFDVVRILDRKKPPMFILENVK